MKIVALLPFKNEERMLPVYLSSITPVVDEIIAIDDGSTDASRDIMEKAGAIVYSSEEKEVSGWAEHSIRQKLIHLGRKHGGTHFVCLDADEAFTAPFAENAKELIASLKPGHKLSMQWLALWKSPYHYRQDESVWSNNYKDFVYCDDGSSLHDYAFLGVGRTPGNNSVDTLVKVQPHQGAVLHFQFVFWREFQLKQAWYRCSELIKYPGTAAVINAKYSITIDDPSARTVPIPEEWLKGVKIPPASENGSLNWHLAEIVSWLNQYGIDFFEPLQIWHISELREEFIKRKDLPGYSSTVQLPNMVPIAANRNIRIAFIKFGGLSAGGTERWLQMMAANLPKDQFDVDYYYCDAAPYVGSDYKHADTDPYRLQYMQQHQVNLIKFSVGAKDITKPTHDWVDTDFWQVFDPQKYDLVQTGKAGPAEYPFYLLNLPVIEFVALNTSVDHSPNIAYSIHPSQWQRLRWFQHGGNVVKSTIIPVPVEPPASLENLRNSLGIPQKAVVAGFHQRADDHIFSPIPLEAFSRVQQPDRHFIVMGGGQAYRRQASQLGIQNVHFLDHSGDAGKISEFLNTLDIFAHGRNDGETFGTVFAEAMLHGKPCLSHASPIANAQQVTMGPSGLFAMNLEEYVTKLEELFADINRRLKLAGKARIHAEKYYSIDSCISTLGSIYYKVLGINRPSAISRKQFQYGQSALGFLYAGDMEKPSEIAHHVAVGAIPESFNVTIARLFLPKVKVFFDIGSNTGLYCCLAANECPQGANIYAFEPQQDCCETLRETIWLNNWEDRVTVHSVGIGNAPGQLTLHIAGSGSTFDNSFNDNAQLPSIAVPVETLDNIVERLAVKKVDFIKIAVEGFEQKVLEGAADVINRDKPVLFIEIVDGLHGRKYRNPNYVRTLQWLNDHGYYIWRCDKSTMQLIPVVSVERQEHINMYLCLHCEAHAQWFYRENDKSAGAVQ